jgi:hypothetical protein
VLPDPRVREDRKHPDMRDREGTEHRDRGPLPLDIVREVGPGEATRRQGGHGSRGRAPHRDGARGAPSTAQLQICMPALPSRRAQAGAHDPHPR